MSSVSPSQPIANPIMASLSKGTVIEALESLQEHNCVAFYEAVEEARRPGHRYMCDCRDVLIEHRLMEPSGTMTEAVRDDILSSTHGIGFGIQIT